MEEPLFINKVEATGIITFDLYDFKPQEAAALVDIKDFLYLGLIVKEKEFKAALSAYGWEHLRGKAVAIVCTEDTIIPTWVYMMLAQKLAGLDTIVDYCTVEELDNKRWQQNLREADLAKYQGEKVVVRARPDVAPALYMQATLRLLPVVSTLMYGEAGMPKVIAKNV
ncbi:DUF2480 family protein [Sphingobacterium sp. MYb382]|uniref:DUF2480 family protein n=1 Tax=Sphingobacterium sp. MYb382 TaxID=2745278 RepID=UPI0030A0AE1A